MTTLSPASGVQSAAAQVSETKHFSITRRQFWNDIAVPLVATRLALLLVGWFASFFPAWPNYPIQEAVQRGWHFSPYRLLDIWGRWDTGWYLSIVRDGYMLNVDHTQQQSNLTFYPLYPLLVRLLLLPIPDGWETDGVILLVGVILSNLFLLGGLLFLYLLTLELTGNVGVARRANLYLLLFPAAFYFSCFYTESIFFFLSVASLYAAQRRAWMWAAVAAALLGVTRPQGILILPVLGWLYLTSIGWRLNRLHPSLLWLLITPIPLMLFLGWVGQATGDFLAPISAQQTWKKVFAMPWTTLFAPLFPNPQITPLEQAAVLLFIIVAVIACWRLPSAAYGLWVLGLILPALFTGILTSSLRYVVVCIPVFIVLAQWGARPTLDRILQMLFFAIQVALMVAWSQFYWVA